MERTAAAVSGGRWLQAYWNGECVDVVDPDAGDGNDGFDDDAVDGAADGRSLGIGDACDVDALQRPDDIDHYSSYAGYRVEDEAEKNNCVDAAEVFF